MKRYMPDGKEEFRPHVDVTSREYEKVFSFLFILDDNDEGATTFPLLKKGSPCRKGSMLVFPPMWTVYMLVQNQLINQNILLVVIYITMIHSLNMFQD